MALNPVQFKFTKMVALLLEHAHAIGFNVRIADAYRNEKCSHGHPNSLHRKYLAIDIDLFDMDGNYLSKTSEHEPLGLYWESIGGTWGGRFDDGNHYSLPTSQLPGMR